MRLKGFFTPEAAVIFSFIAFFTVGTIRLVYTLHDRVLNDSSKIQAGIRMYQAENFYYDTDSGKIDYTGIICSPVLKTDEDNFKSTEEKVMKKINDYYYEHCFGTDKNMTLSDYYGIINTGKNADVIRAGGRMAEFIGDIVDGN